MKLALLICLFIAGTATARAQSTAHLPAEAAAPEAAAAPKTTATAPARNVVYLTPENQWSMVDMKVTDGTAWFMNIKGLSSLHVYVTDNTGQVQLEQKLSARSNGVDVSRLRKGNYFITIINENTEERKAFQLNL